MSDGGKKTTKAGNAINSLQLQIWVKLIIIWKGMFVDSTFFCHGKYLFHLTNITCDIHHSVAICFIGSIGSWYTSGATCKNNSLIKLSTEFIAVCIKFYTNLLISFLSDNTARKFHRGCNWLPRLSVDGYDWLIRLTNRV